MPNLIAVGQTIRAYYLRSARKMTS